MSSEERRKEMERRSSFLSEKVGLVKKAVLSSVKDAINPLVVDKDLPLHMRASAMIEGNRPSDD